MLCYDRTKCGVNGPQLARLTQRQRGVIPPAISVSAVRGMGGHSGMGMPSPEEIGQATKDANDIIGTIKNFFGGLFGKNADKAQFDSVRQNVWNQFAVIVNAVDRLKSSDQLSRDTLQGYMRSLQTLIENFNSYYDRVRAKVTPAYGDSRFHDFYDVFLAKYDEWQQESLSMPAGGFFGGLTGKPLDGTTMLMLGGLALMFLRRSPRA